LWANDLERAPLREIGPSRPSAKAPSSLQILGERRGLGVE
jgi:hypothetical protein